MTNVIKFGTDGWRAIIAEDFTFWLMGKARSNTNYNSSLLAKTSELNTYTAYWRCRYCWM